MDLPLLAAIAIRNNSIGFKAKLRDFNASITRNVNNPEYPFFPESNNDKFVYSDTSKTNGPKCCDNNVSMTAVQKYDNTNSEPFTLFNGDKVIVVHNDELIEGTLSKISAENGNQVDGIEVTTDNSLKRFSIYKNQGSVDIFSPVVFDKWAPKNATGEALDYWYSNTSGTSVGLD